MSDTDAGQLVAKAAAEAFGGTASLALHEDKEKSGALGVVTAVDSPERGMVSCGTVGFMAHDMGLKAEGRSLRAEMVMAGPSTEESLPELLVSCALGLAHSGRSCGHAKVVPDIVPATYSTHDLRHALFTVPFLWDGPEMVRFDDVLVAWLLVVPISDAERTYAVERGVDALEEVFRRDGVNVFDLDREPAV